MQQYDESVHGAYGNWYRTIYLKSLHWKLYRFRKKVFSYLTDSYSCADCGNRDKRYLDLNHYVYSLGREKLRHTDWYCNAHTKNRCHRKFHATMGTINIDE